MSEEELMLKSAIYAVEHLLMQGYRTYYTKDKTGTYKVDYTDVLKYLKNKLDESNKKSEEFNVYDVFNDMTSDDDIKDLM